MKNIISSLLKFIMIFLIVFLLFFLMVFVFYLFPFLKVKTDKILLYNLLNIIFVPAYFNALFNSLILSTFLYGIFVLNYYVKYRFRASFVSTCFSTLFIFVSLSIFNPDYDSMEHILIDDARLFFDEKVFFEYNYSPPILYEKDFFEKELLIAANTKKNKQLLSNSYQYDSYIGKYQLKDMISPLERRNIGILLQDMGYFTPTRFYFEKIEPKFIRHAIIVKNNIPMFFDYLSVDFLSEKIILRNQKNEQYDYSKVKTKNVLTPDEQQEERKYEFFKNSLDNFFIDNGIVSSFIFKHLKYTAFNSLKFNTIYTRCLFWFSIIFFIFSLCTLIITPTFPLLIIIIRFFLVVFFYMFSTYILQIYNATNFYLSSGLEFIGPYLVSLIWLLLAIVVNIIKVMFFNKNSLERNL